MSEAKEEAVLVLVLMFMFGANCLPLLVSHFCHRFAMSFVFSLFVSFHIAKLYVSMCVCVQHTHTFRSIVNVDSRLLSVSHALRLSLSFSV